MARFRVWLLSKYSYQICGWICWAGLAAMLSPLAKLAGERVHVIVSAITATALVGSYGLLALQAYWETR